MLRCFQLPNSRIIMLIKGVNQLLLNLSLLGVGAVAEKAISGDLIAKFVSVRLVKSTSLMIVPHSIMKLLLHY